MVLALVRSEAVSLVGFFRDELATQVGPKRLKAASLRAARTSPRRPTASPARCCSTWRSAPDAPMKAAVAFTALFRAQVVALVEALEPGSATGEDAFQQLVAPEAMAQRLRKDLWVFGQLCRATELALRSEDVAAAEAALSAFESYLATSRT